MSRYTLDQTLSFKTFTHAGKSFLSQVLITGPYEAIFEEIHERNREDAEAVSQEPEAVDLQAR